MTYDDRIAQILSSPVQQVGRLSELEGVVEQCVSSFDLRQARALVKRLEQVVGSLPPSFQTRVRGLAARLKILALPLYLTREEVLDPFRRGFGVVLQHEDPNIIQRIRARLLDVPMSERDQWRQDMVAALHQNTDAVTSVGPKSETQAIRGTVGAWLSNYDQIFGVDLVDNIQVADYLFRSKWAKEVPAAEKNVLSKLFNVYEYLKLSSETAMGLDEEYDFTDERFVWDFNNGRPVPILDLATGQSVRRSKVPVGMRPGHLETPPVAPRVVVSSPPAPAQQRVSSLVVQRPAPAVTTPQLPLRVSEYRPNAVAAAAPLAPAPAAIKSAEPALIFDEQDEREADAFRSKSKSEEERVVLERELRRLADEVIKQHNFSFKDETNRRRFVNLFVSFLKNVRSVVDVREVLTKPTEAGGLGLAADKVDQVVKIFEAARKEFEVRGKGRGDDARPMTKPVGALDKLVEAELAPFLLRGTEGSKPAAMLPKVEVSAPKVTIEHATIVVPSPGREQGSVQPPAPPPAPAAPKAPLPPGGFAPDKVEAWRQEMLKEIARVAPPAFGRQQPPPRQPVPEAAQLPPAAPPLSAGGGRPQLADVKAPRTLGPLGELKSLSLTDFRRLGPVLTALDKVLAKIELVGEASIAKRLEAVRAWQASPTYREYLRLGRESIEQGRPVVELAAELDSRGEETLTEAEFSAIADFNAKLRF